jgi:hypothetical protein
MSYWNDRPVSASWLGLTRAAQFSTDDGTPVTEAYKVTFKFTETIAAVTIELKEMKKADRDDATQARRAAALKKGLADQREPLPGGSRTFDADAH